MTVPAGGAAAPGGSALQGFVIAGSTYSYDSVARLLSRLALVPDLADVTLTSSTAGETTTVEFNITAAVKGPCCAGGSRGSRSSCGYIDGGELVRNLKLTKGKTIALIVGGDLLLLAFGWFLLVALAAGDGPEQLARRKRDGGSGDRGQEGLSSRHRGWSRPSSRRFRPRTSTNCRRRCR
jgi:hypothetical protein